MRCTLLIALFMWIKFPLQLETKNVEKGVLSDRDENRTADQQFRPCREKCLYVKSDLWGKNKAKRRHKTFQDGFRIKRLEDVENVYVRVSKDDTTEVILPVILGRTKNKKTDDDPQDKIKNPKAKGRSNHFNGIKFIKSLLHRSNRYTDDEKNTERNHKSILHKNGECSTNFNILHQQSRYFKLIRDGIGVHYEGNSYSHQFSTDSDQPQEVLEYEIDTEETSESTKAGHSYSTTRPGKKLTFEVDLEKTTPLPPDESVETLKTWETERRPLSPLTFIKSTVDPTLEAPASAVRGNKSNPLGKIKYADRPLKFLPTYLSSSERPKECSAVPTKAYRAGTKYRTFRSQTIKRSRVPAVTASMNSSNLDDRLEYDYFNEMEVTDVKRKSSMVHAGAYRGYKTMRPEIPEKEDEEYFDDLSTETEFLEKRLSPTRGQIIGSTSNELVRNMFTRRTSTESETLPFVNRYFDSASDFIEGRHRDSTTTSERTINEKHPFNKFNMPEMFPFTDTSSNTIPRLQEDIEAHFMKPWQLQVVAQASSQPSETRRTANIKTKNHSASTTSPNFSERERGYGFDEDEFMKKYTRAYNRDHTRFNHIRDHSYIGPPRKNVRAEVGNIKSKVLADIITTEGTSVNSPLTETISNETTISNESTIPNDTSTLIEGTTEEEDDDDEDEEEEESDYSECNNNTAQGSSSISTSSTITTTQNLEKVMKRQNTTSKGQKVLILLDMKKKSLTNTAGPTELGIKYTGEEDENENNYDEDDYSNYEFQSSSPHSYFLGEEDYPQLNIKRYSGVRYLKPIKKVYKKWVTTVPKESAPRYGRMKSFYDRLFKKPRQKETHTCPVRRDTIQHSKYIGKRTQAFLKEDFIDKIIAERKSLTSTSSKETTTTESSSNSIVTVVSTESSTSTTESPRNTLAKGVSTENRVSTTDSPRNTLAKGVSTENRVSTTDSPRNTLAKGVSTENRVSTTESPRNTLAKGVTTENRVSTTDSPSFTTGERVSTESTKETSITTNGLSKAMGHTTDPKETCSTEISTDSFRTTSNVMTWIARSEVTRSSTKTSAIIPAYNHTAEISETEKVGYTGTRNKAEGGSTSILPQIIGRTKYKKKYANEQDKIEKYQVKDRSNRFKGIKFIKSLLRGSNKNSDMKKSQSNNKSMLLKTEECSTKFRIPNHEHSRHFKLDKICDPPIEGKNYSESNSASDLSQPQEVLKNEIGTKEPSKSTKTIQYYPKKPNNKKTCLEVGLNETTFLPLIESNSDHIVNLQQTEPTPLMPLTFIKVSISPTVEASAFDISGMNKTLPLSKTEYENKNFHMHQSSLESPKECLPVSTKAHTKFWNFWSHSLEDSQISAVTASMDSSDQNHNNELEELNHHIFNKMGGSDAKRGNESSKMNVVIFINKNMTFSGITCETVPSIGNLGTSTNYENRSPDVPDMYDEEYLDDLLSKNGTEFKKNSLTISRDKTFTRMKSSESATIPLVKENFDGASDSIMGEPKESISTSEETINVKHRFEDINAHFMRPWPLQQTNELNFTSTILQYMTEPATTLRKSYSRLKNPWENTSPNPIEHKNNSKFDENEFMEKYTAMAHDKNHIGVNNFEGHNYIFTKKEFGVDLGVKSKVLSDKITTENTEKSTRENNSLTETAIFNAPSTVEEELIYDNDDDDTEEEDDSDYSECNNSTAQESFSSASTSSTITTAQNPARVVKWKWKATKSKEKKVEIVFDTKKKGTKMRSKSKELFMQGTEEEDEDEYNNDEDYCFNYKFQSSSLHPCFCDQQDYPQLSGKKYSGIKERGTKKVTNSNIWVTIAPKNSEVQQGCFKQFCDKLFKKHGQKKIHTSPEKRDTSPHFKGNGKRTQSFLNGDFIDKIIAEQRSSTSKRTERIVSKTDSTVSFKSSVTDILSTTMSTNPFQPGEIISSTEYFVGEQEIVNLLRKTMANEVNSTDSLNKVIRFLKNKSLHTRRLLKNLNSTAMRPEQLSNDARHYDRLVNIVSSLRESFHLKDVLNSVNAQSEKQRNSAGIVNPKNLKQDPFSEIWKRTTNCDYKVTREVYNRRGTTPRTCNMPGPTTGISEKRRTTAGISKTNQNNNSDPDIICKYVIESLLEYITTMVPSKLVHTTHVLGKNSTGNSFRNSSPSSFLDEFLCMDIDSMTFAPKVQAISTIAASTENTISTTESSWSTIITDVSTATKSTKGTSKNTNGLSRAVGHTAGSDGTCPIEMSTDACNNTSSTVMSSTDLTEVTSTPGGTSALFSCTHTHRSMSVTATVEYTVTSAKTQVDSTNTSSESEVESSRTKGASQELTATTNGATLEGSTLTGNLSTVGSEPNKNGFCPNITIINTKCNCRDESKQPKVFPCKKLLTPEPWNRIDRKKSALSKTDTLVIRKGNEVAQLKITVGNPLNDKSVNNCPRKVI